MSSTEKTLEEGINKMTQVYKNFENVGIKDRSMIWNSYVALRKYRMGS